MPLVEVEVTEKHEHFLTKTFPKILSEEVNKKLNKKSGAKKLLNKKRLTHFLCQILVLDEDRTQVEKKHTAKKNPTIKRSQQLQKGLNIWIKLLV